MLLDRIRSALTGTPAAYYAARRASLRELRHLEDRLATAVRRQEAAADYWGSFVPPIGWDGAPGWGAGGVMAPTGTTSDRRGGRDVPLFWSEIQLRQFRILSRWLCETNRFAIGFLGLLADFHLRKGFGWQVTLRGANAPTSADAAIDPAEVDPDVRACQEVLDEFRRGNPLVPGTGWRPQAREGFRRWRRDGEVFLRLFRGGPGTRGVPVVRYVEPEQIGSPDGDTGTERSFGILSAPGDITSRLAYYVRDPETGTGGRWVRAAGADGADLAGLDLGPGRIVSLTANVDATIKRGLPDFLPVSDQLERAAELLDAMSQTAAVQARIAWIQRYAAGTPGAVVSNMIEQGRDYSRPKAYPPLAPGSPDGRSSSVRRDEPGSVLHVENGREFLPGPAAAGAVAGWVQVEQASLRGAGVRWRFPEYFSGDASNANFASTKEAGSPFVAAVEGGQDDWGDFELAVASNVLALAAEAGRLSPAAVERVCVHVTAPKVVLADPLAEDQRREIQHRSGVLSAAEWVRMDGRDPKVTFANIKQERETFPDQGGPPDLSQLLGDAP